MEENIQDEELQDEIEEKKDYSSFENYTKKQVTLIGYLLGIKEFHITNPPFDQAYLQKIKGIKEIEIIRALSILRLNFIYAYDKIYREKQTKGPFAQFDKMEQMIDAEALHYLFESEETIKEQEQYRKQKLIRKLDGVNEVYFMEIAKLLKDERQFSGNDTNSFINRVYYTARKFLFFII